MLRQPHALILVCVVILVMAAVPVLPAASQTTYIPWRTFTTDAVSYTHLTLPTIYSV